MNTGEFLKVLSDCGVPNLLYANAFYSPSGSLRNLVEDFLSVEEDSWRDQHGGITVECFLKWMRRDPPTESDLGVKDLVGLLSTGLKWYDWNLVHDYFAHSCDVFRHVYFFLKDTTWIKENGLKLDSFSKWLYFHPPHRKAACVQKLPLGMFREAGNTNHARTLMDWMIEYMPTDSNPTVIRFWKWMKEKDFVFDEEETERIVLHTLRNAGWDIDVNYIGEIDGIPAPLSDFGKIFMQDYNWRIDHGISQESFERWAKDLSEDYWGELKALLKKEGHDLEGEYYNNRVLDEWATVFCNEQRNSNVRAFWQWMADHRICRDIE